VGPQSSEHGIVAISPAWYNSSCLAMEGDVFLLRHPNPVEQNRQLTGNGNNGFALGLLSSSRSKV
jgi:hypothetical protein